MNKYRESRVMKDCARSWPTPIGFSGLDDQVAASELAERGLLRYLIQDNRVVWVLTGKGINWLGERLPLEWE